MTALTFATDTFTSNSTDADFRQWGSTISAHLAAAGLVQTADSGQINWTTVTRPTVNNTDGGYEVWRFDDPLQATAPIFIKIGYGGASPATIPRTVMSVGTGTNGAGTLTGLVSDSRVVNSASSATAGTYVSKVCYVDGFFGCAIYRGVQGASGIPIFGVMVQRTCDDSGAWTGDGCTTVWATSGAAAAGMQSLNFLKGTKTTYGSVHTFFPSGGANTLTDDVVPNYQPARSYQPFPKVRPLLGSCGVYGVETPLDVQFQVALVGTTPRNYICMGAFFGTSQCPALTTWYQAMLWE